MAKTVKSEVADIAIRTAAYMAAEAERAAIVAWLRSLKTGAISPDHAADDIESGVHLNAEQVTR